MTTLNHRHGRPSGGVRLVAWTGCALLLAGASGPVTAQAATEHGHRDMMPAGSMPQMAAMPMVMPTDDNKVFRLIRPAVAALQVKLAEDGSFSGAINGLLGPSTVRSLEAYQLAHGLEATGLPDLETVLDLMEWDGAYEAVLEHLDLELPPEPMSGHAMDGGMRMGMQSMTVDGDPQQPKSLMSMEMPGMVMDNDHARAVRAAREFLAALQRRVIEEHSPGGPARGLPQGASFADGIAGYQESHGLEQTGTLDLATALELLNSDGERMISKYRDRIDLKATPVAMDQDLQRVSNGRAKRPGGR